MSDVILILSLVLSTVAFSLVASWHVWPWLSRAPLARGLEPLLLLHSFRHLGLMFLADGALKAPLPAAFAQPAAWGDLAAALLAFGALLALRRGWRHAIPMVWVFNVVGTLDLLYAVTQGARNGAAAGMGAAFWIPSVLVPALLVTHALVFATLLREGRPRALRAMA